uniref:Uncharacterized protein n=1 Tax=viral metagenome TaxID=1070528 RepID=A0A6C0CKF7_9ZZZZ
MPTLPSLFEIWGTSKGETEEFPKSDNTLQEKDKLNLQQRPTPIVEGYGREGGCATNDVVGTSTHYSEYGYARIEAMLQKYMKLQRFETYKNNNRIVNILIVILVILLLGMFTLMYMLSNLSAGYPYPRCI